MNKHKQHIKNIQIYKPTCRLIKMVSTLNEFDRFHQFQSLSDAL
jgi:hypothetical protein